MGFVFKTQAFLAEILINIVISKQKGLILMANKHRQALPPKKKKADKRTIWVRVMAVILALLMAASVLGVIFTTITV